MAASWRTLPLPSTGVLVTWERQERWIIRWKLSPSQESNSPGAQWTFSSPPLCPLCTLLSTVVEASTSQALLLQEPPRGRRQLPSDCQQGQFLVLTFHHIQLPWGQPWDWAKTDFQNWIEISTDPFERRRCTTPLLSCDTASCMTSWYWPMATLVEIRFLQKR